MIAKIKKLKNKKNKSKIICLTAYSKNVAEVIDQYSDIILIGDSLGSVLYNYNSTRKVTLNTMIEHSKSAKLGIQKSLMVVDMPYKTYRNKSEALKNAKKIIKLTKCDAVKLEGGIKISKIIEHLIKIFSKENSLVVDPFLGSGTTALACKNTNRRCIGLEINSEYYEISKTRCEITDSIV